MAINARPGSTRASGRGPGRLRRAGALPSRSPTGSVGAGIEGPPFHPPAPDAGPARTPRAASCATRPPSSLPRRATRREGRPSSSYGKEYYHKYGFNVGRYSAAISRIANRMSSIPSRMRSACVRKERIQMRTANRSLRPLPAGEGGGEGSAGASEHESRSFASSFAEVADAPEPLWRRRASEDRSLRMTGRERRDDRTDFGHRLVAAVQLTTRFR